MGLRLSVLGSGSKGNSVYVATRRVNMLIDAGLSARETERRLAEIGASARNLDVILVTHEHIDHVRGLGTLSRRYKLPAYLNRGTFANLHNSVGSLTEKVEFATGRSFSVEDLIIHPFAISHDAADPVGFTLENGSVKIGLCTDLGAATQLVRRRLRDCKALILEANHDVHMLNNGPYPWPIKQRIRSRSGHLSNEQSGKVLTQVFSEGLKQVVLAHVSETNNCPGMVLSTFINVLPRDMREHLRLVLASQQDPLDPIEFD